MSWTIGQSICDPGSHTRHQTGSRRLHDPVLAVHFAGSRHGIQLAADAEAGRVQPGTTHLWAGRGDRKAALAAADCEEGAVREVAGNGIRGSARRSTRPGSTHRPVRPAPAGDARQGTQRSGRRGTTCGLWRRDHIPRRHANPWLRSPAHLSAAPTLKHPDQEASLVFHADTARVEPP
jgi:hypothetical protein